MNENTYLFFVIYCLVRQLLWSLVFNSTFNNSYNYMTASFIGGGNLAKSNDTEIQHKIGKQKYANLKICTFLIYNPKTHKQISFSTR